MRPLANLKTAAVRAKSLGCSTVHLQMREHSQRCINVISSPANQVFDSARRQPYIPGAHLRPGTISTLAFGKLVGKCQRSLSSAPGAVGKKKGIGKKLPIELLMVEGALESGEDDLILKNLAKLTPEQHVLVLKDLYKRQMTADGFEKIDADQDGKISAEEYDKYFKTINDNQFRNPSNRQLVLVAVASGVPFIGFGFMDNSLMIVFGETIEMNLGVLLGLSTMACAATGNLISDVIGVGFSGYIEVLAKSFGVKEPLLTPSQLKLFSVRVTSSLGAAIGISIGCVLGMFPLLLMEGKPDKEVQVA